MARQDDAQPRHVITEQELYTAILLALGPIPEGPKRLYTASFTDMVTADIEHCRPAWWAAQNHIERFAYVETAWAAFKFWCGYKKLARDFQK